VIQAYNYNTWEYREFEAAWATWQDPIFKGREGGREEEETREKEKGEGGGERRKGVQEEKVLEQVT
jgi:hypothetical protein